MGVIELAERRIVPDRLIRVGIRQLVAQRLREERRKTDVERSRFLRTLEASELALHAGTANEQHYEVPTEFFQCALGPMLKYSGSIFPTESSSLAEAEAHTLNLYVETLNLQAGDRVLDLGCGWGSFSLWAAERVPEAEFTAVSNSATQKAFIDARARAKGVQNLTVLTEDVNNLHFPATRFTKIVSVEMFEHVRNYSVLFGRLAEWLARDGRLFVHIFCHREFLYPFETEGEGNWMGRYFFTGGLMPAADTLAKFRQTLALESTSLHAGTHYAKTARAWLDNMDRHQDELHEVFQSAYGEDASIWLQRWRMFFMAVEEMFAYQRGREWQIGHYLFRKP